MITRQNALRDLKKAGRVHLRTRAGSRTGKWFAAPSGAPLGDMKHKEISYRTSRVLAASVCASAASRSRCLCTVAFLFRRSWTSARNNSCPSYSVRVADSEGFRAAPVPVQPEPKQHHEPAHVTATHANTSCAPTLSRPPRPAARCASVDPDMHVRPYIRCKHSVWMAVLRHLRPKEW